MAVVGKRWWWLAGVMLAVVLLSACRPPPTQEEWRVERFKTIRDRDTLDEARASGLDPEVRTGLIDEHHGKVTWWRLTLLRDISRMDKPQLVVGRTYPATLDVWGPDDTAPRRYGLNEPDAYLSGVRALSVPLPAGFKSGDSMIMRVDTLRQLQMPVSVSTQDAMAHDDERFIASRWSIYAALIVLGLLSIGHAVGSRERAYGWLGLLMLAELLYLMVDGGEVRWIPLLRDISAGAHLRNTMVSVAVIAAAMFCRDFLELRREWPLGNGVLVICVWASALAWLAGILMLGFAAPLGNLAIVVLCLVTIIGALRGARERRTDGALLLLAWLPLLVLVLVRIGEMQHWWWLPGSFEPAFGAVFVFAGLLLNLALSGKLRRFRLERDSASHEARIDPLTGALTRKAIEQSLEETLRNARAHRQPFSIAFVDVDNFKPINDRHGHPVGDACLRYVSKRVRGRLRVDDLLGRYGGDEFLVLMPGTHLTEARERADRLLQTVNCRPVAVEDRLLDCTLSIGVAEWNGQEASDSLLARADRALYVSKENGRNRVTGVDAEGLVQSVPAAAN